MTPARKLPARKTTAQRGVAAAAAKDAPKSAAGSTALTPEPVRRPAADLPPALAVWPD
jgi:hypothetical protein